MNINSLIFKIEITLNILEIYIYVKKFDYDLVSIKASILYIITPYK